MPLSRPGRLRSRSVRLRQLTAGSAFILGLLAPLATADAADYVAQKIFYRNKGAYIAHFVIAYELDGKPCRMMMENEHAASAENKTLRIDLSKATELEAAAYWTALEDRVQMTDYCEGKSIPEGTEVWGIVFIVAGERENCRKTTPLLYRNDGGTMTYWSGGTTYNVNRCRVASWPGTAVASSE